VTPLQEALSALKQRPDQKHLAEYLMSLDEGSRVFDEGDLVSVVMTVEPTKFLLFPEYLSESLDLIASDGGLEIDATRDTSDWGKRPKVAVVGTHAHLTCEAIKRAVTSLSHVVETAENAEHMKARVKRAEDVENYGLEVVEMGERIGLSAVHIHDLIERFRDCGLNASRAGASLVEAAESLGKLNDRFDPPAFPRSRKRGDLKLSACNRRRKR